MFLHVSNMWKTVQVWEENVKVGLMIMLENLYLYREWSTGSRNCKSKV